MRVVGVTDRVTEGTIKSVALVAVPPRVTTLILPVLAPAGTVALICTDEVTLNSAPVPLNVTLVAPVKLVPLIVTSVPSSPLPGLKSEIVGGGGLIVKLAETEVIVISVAVALTLKALVPIVVVDVVSIERTELFPVVGSGLKLPEVPEGSPLTVKSTEPEKLTRLMDTV